MIKFAEESLDITVTRKDHDDKNDTRISISLDNNKGIRMNAVGGIYIISDKNVYIGATQKTITEINQALKSTEEKFYSSYNAGKTLYEKHLARLDDDWGNFWLCRQEELRAEGSKWVESGKDFIFWDTWHKTKGPTFNDEIEAGDRGVLDFYAKTIDLSVGDIFVTLNDSRLDSGTIYITSSLFEWLGYEPTSGYEPVYEELHDGWEKFLDGVTAVLAVATIVLAVAALTVSTAGVGTAALIAGVTGGALAFSRGDRVGGLISMLPIVGEAAKATSNVKKATILFDLGANLVQLGFGVPRIICEFRNSLKEMNELEDKEGLKGCWNMIKCWDDVLFAAVDITMNVVSIHGGRKDLKGIKESRNTKNLLDTDTPPTKTDTTINRTETLAGDPVNMVTGALTIHYTDLKLKDIAGDFSLIRTYRSVYKNENKMLGSRWLFNIESSLYREDNEIQIFLPDTHKEAFEKSEETWNNTKTGNKRYDLYETETGYYLQDNHTHTSYSYDRKGKLKQISDRNGNTTYYEYTADLLSKMVFAGGQELYFTYADNKLVHIKDKAGREYRYQYDGDLLRSVTYPNDGVTYEYTPKVI